MEDILKEIEDFLLQGGIQKYTNLHRLRSSQLLLKFKLIELEGSIISSIKKTQSEAAKSSSEYAEEVNIYLQKIKERLKIIQHKANQEPSLERYQSVISSFLKPILSILPDIKSTKRTTNKKKSEKISFKYQFKKNKDILNELYDFNLLEGRLINDDKTDRKTFIDILISDDVTKAKGQIHFECETMQAVFILRELKPLFKKFNHSQIAKSGKFYTSDGNLLTETNSYQSYRKATNNLTIEEETNISELRSLINKAKNG